MLHGFRADFVKVYVEIVAVHGFRACILCSVLVGCIHGFQEKKNETGRHIRLHNARIPCMYNNARIPCITMHGFRASIIYYVE